MSSDYEDSFEDEEEEGYSDDSEEKEENEGEKKIGEDRNSIKSDDKLDGIPRFAQPMYIPHTIYRTSYRATHSDVMCTTITSRRTDWAKQRKKKDKNHGILCRLPYEEQFRTSTTSISTRGGDDDATTTPLEQKQSALARQKLNKELHAEHRVFMERLRKERDERTKAETEASVTIQRFMRGLAVRERRHPEKYAAMRKPFKYSDDGIRRLINEATRKLGLPPIPDENIDFSTIRPLEEKEADRTRSE